MCGIIGEVCFNAVLTDRDQFISLRKLGAARGPDDQGYETDNRRYQFGFNRLAILDLSQQGHQPMYSPSRRYVVVFNGEIYNHQLLRDKIADAHLWKGSSDTESLVAALERFGVRKTIEMLDGMFAIAIYDTETSTTYLVRDFAGIKPLHFGFKDGRLLFASQYDQISKHPQFATSEIDPSVLKTYLMFHYIPAPLGLLHHTHQVRPGEIVTFDRHGNKKSERYWELPVDVKPTICDKTEALEFIDQHLELAVQDELHADVPLGSFLSGGIDSPLITHYARQHSSREFKSFSIGSDSSIHDESTLARQYADAIGVDFHLSMMDSTRAKNIFFDALDTLREPFADFSIIPTYLVSHTTRSDLTVALSGDGGDELFFGYERFYSVLQNLKFRKIPKQLRYLAYGTSKLIDGNRTVNSNLLAERLSDAHKGLHSRMSEFQVDALFPHLKGVTLPKAFDAYNYPDSSDPLEMLCHMRKAEFYGMMQKTLTKVDRASMGVSLEVRVPFLKKSFIEASLQVDPMLSYGSKMKKELLKELLRRKIPSAPIDNTKRGFTVPLGKWIREDLRPDFEQLPQMLAPFQPDTQQLDRLIRIHMDGKSDRKWPLFTLYSLGHWNRT